MKIAVTGKGGVGKTTFTAMLCNSLEKEGIKVLAVDADPDANLAATLGFPEDRHPTPVSELKDLIAERTGAQPGTWGGIFKLNPKVDDIPDKYCLRRGSLSLLVMGTVEKGGSGCVCPESAFIKALISHMVFQSDQHLIMDMEAGLEHLGRGTTRMMDALVVVVRPDAKSSSTARRIIPLWEDLGNKKILFVGNEARTPADVEYLKKELKDHPLLGVIPESEKIRNSGRENMTPFEDERVNEVIKEIRARLEQELAGN
ncbi:MAG TPA: AAA family ATPase [bacterium]|nr:AAA family ATPase [bacterium]